MAKKLLAYARSIRRRINMKKLAYLIALAFLSSCNESGTSGNSSDSSYQSITDTSVLVNDSLPIPDSTTPTVVH
ncbi:MAG TPA: hypothetical protein VFQ73_09295 [Flavisolibacter sp.]|jgi:hypothetical protein|nr:hypothetical protein [Flavisolibacter sp.]